MYAKVLTICIFASVLVNGVFSFPPLQLEPQVGGLPDHVISFGKIASSTRDRLPTEVVPSHYKVEIWPRIDDPTDTVNFKTAPGHVNITVNCVEATKLITLNSFEITINNPVVVSVFCFVLRCHNCCKK